jgi:hypothetical protein
MLINMQKQFTQFADNIRLTVTQEADAKTKYDGVCTKLHTSYYDTDYDGSTKLLFGSYKTKTNVRPLSENQDVDVLFKIPKETYEKFKAYESNGPSALLQEVKGFLNEKYTTTDEIKAWGKIVHVKFSDNSHNIEVLPAYEEEDGTFTIPNSENGGSWDEFDPREQIISFQASNNTTNGLTAELTRMIKTWVDNTSSCSYKSYNLLGDVMKFLESEFKTGADYSEYSKIVKNFFEYLKNNCEKDIESSVKTAIDRANKAYDYENEDKPKEASEEWRKIFGKDGKSEFPLVSENPVKENKTRTFSTPSSPYGCYKFN